MHRTRGLRLQFSSSHVVRAGLGWAARLCVQSYHEITSDAYLAFIGSYVVGIGPWKDTLVPPDPTDNRLGRPADLVARAHALRLQVHPYTFRNENQYLHFDFRQDPYAEYAYWLDEVAVDGLFTDFTGSLHKYQEWTRPYRKEQEKTSPEALLREIAGMLKNDGYD
jgi:glycerophosphoryl diester phosphodiesterase